MNKCTEVRALRSCSGDVHVARVVVSLVVHAVVGLTLGLIAHVVVVVFCEGEGDVVGVVAPLGGVAQVIFDGVRLSRSVCRSGCIRTEEWKKTEEGQVEVEREEDEDQGEQHMCNMA